MFTTKQVSTRDIGEFLAECRGNLGMSAIEVGKLTQVQPKFITALEEGCYEVLPDEVYVRGFLRRLALAYRLNALELENRYLAERGIAANLQEPEKPKEDIEISHFVLSPRTLTLMGIAGLMLFSLAYLYFQVSSLRRPPELRLLSPAADGAVHSSLLVVEGTTESGASVFLNNQEIVVDSSGVFRENLSLGPGTNQLIIRSVNKFDKETVITRSIALVEKEIAGSSTGTPAILPEAASAGVTLELAIGPEAVWIHIETDGQEEFSGTMLKGAVRKITAKDRIVLTTGNAGSTRAKLNGKDLGVLGKENEVLRDLEFTK